MAFVSKFKAYGFEDPNFEREGVRIYRPAHSPSVSREDAGGPGILKEHLSMIGKIAEGRNLPSGISKLVNAAKVQETSY